MQKGLIRMVQVLAGAAQGGVSLATSVSDAMRQRRELPLEPYPRTGSRGVWAALFVPTVLQHAWEQAALPRPLSIPAILSSLFACGINFASYSHALFRNSCRKLGSRAARGLNDATRVAADLRAAINAVPNGRSEIAATRFSETIERRNS